MANPTIGFIGYGNMAQAIAEGLVNAGTINGSDIVACAAHYDKLERNAAKLGAKAVRTAAQVAEAADMVVIAIKPYQIETVIAPIIDQLAQENTIVVSIAAGWDLNKFRDLFGTSFEQAHIQCTIPNTPMAVGKGVLVTEVDNTLTITLPDPNVAYDRVLQTLPGGPEFSAEQTAFHFTITARTTTTRSLQIPDAAGKQWTLFLKKQ